MNRKPDAPDGCIMPASGKVLVSQKTSAVEISANGLQRLSVNYVHPATQGEIPSPLQETGV